MPRLVLLVIGLAVGAVSGYLIRPATAELKFGSLDIEVQSDQWVTGQLPAAREHIAVFTLIGVASD